MKPSELKLLLARLLGLTAVFCGLIGLIIGIVGWFTGGTLLAVLALFLLGGYVRGAQTREGALTEGPLYRHQLLPWNEALVVHCQGRAGGIPA